MRLREMAMRQVITSTQKDFGHDLRSAVLLSSRRFTRARNISSARSEFDVSIQIEKRVHLPIHACRNYSRPLKCLFVLDAVYNRFAAGLRKKF